MLHSRGTGAKGFPSGPSADIFSCSRQGRRLTACVVVGMIALWLQVLIWSTQLESEVNSYLTPQENTKTSGEVQHGT